MAARPEHVKKASYESRAEAEQAQQAYGRIAAGSTVEVVEDDDVRPPTAEPPDEPPARRRRGRGRTVDLPPSVR